MTAALAEPRTAARSPGLYYALDRAEYEKIDALNFSTLKYIRQSPAHARHARLCPDPPTPAQELGTLIHSWLLEPDRWADTHIELPDLTQNLKTKNGETPKNPTATAEYKARLEEFGRAHAGKRFVRPDEMALLRGIDEAAAACPAAARALCGHGEDTAAETVAVWNDPVTGLACKAMMDVIDRTPEHGRVVTDLKSTTDASPGPFARQAAQCQYHLQAAWYLWGLSVLEIPARRFLHVAVEVKPPYGVAVYELDDAAIDQGLRTNRGYLDCWSRCVQSGRWPAYADRVEPLSLPRYALTRDDE